MHPKFTKHLLAAFTIGIQCVVGAATSAATRPIDRSFQAQWIWSNVATLEPFQFVRFRKTFDLAAIPAEATAYITADTFYRLWINGQLAMHGPARSSAGKATVDPVDVTQYLKPGENMVVAQAFHGNCPFEALAQAPGFLCELEITSGGTRQVVATDATWQATEISAWNRQSPRFSFQRGWMEDYDSRRELEEVWQPAMVLGPVGMSPWTRVELRDVPLPAPLEPVYPVSVVSVQRGDGFVGPCGPGDARIMGPPLEWDLRSVFFRRLQTERVKPDESAVTHPGDLTNNGTGDAVLHGDGATVTYDFGRGHVGFIGLEVTGQAGQVLEIAWNEQLPQAEPTARPHAQVGNNALRYILRNGRQSFLAFTPQFIRFLRIAHRGESDLTVHKLWVTEFRFVAEPKGDFICSDEDLNRVYQAAKWTTALNTLDAFMDCPHRERNANYGIEAHWAQKAVYSLFGDSSIMRRSIGYGADSVHDPHRFGPPGIVQADYPMDLRTFTLLPQQSLLWVVNLGLYERCSHDREFIRRMIPVLRENLAAFDGYRNTDGLLENLSGLFFDYAQMRTDSVSVAINARFAMALDEAARLERLAGDAVHAARYAEHAREVRSSLNRYCVGDLFYPDVLARDAQQNLVRSSEACETTQYYVMWANVPPEDRQRRMWQALRDDFVPTPRRKIEPIQGLTRGGLYSFQERLEVGARLGDHAALVRDTKAMFLPMVETPPGTLWEDPMAQIALCHSIACGVAGIMTEELLGIRMGMPLKITPHSGDSLRWCKGYTTTSEGRVQVAWDGNDTRYTMRISLPDGIAAEVWLPPEAKSVWQSASVKTPWPEPLRVAASTEIIVEPGKVTAVTP